MSCCDGNVPAAANCGGPCGCDNNNNETPIPGGAALEKPNAEGSGGCENNGCKCGPTCNCNPCTCNK